MQKKIKSKVYLCGSIAAGRDFADNLKLILGKFFKKYGK